MKQSEIKELSTDNVKIQLAETQSLYNKLKLNHAVSPLENPLKIRVTRKTIARLKTELNTRTA
jgi:large subunit ribosomal protein L29